jgi:hypothetical protein
VPNSSSWGARNPSPWHYHPLEHAPFRSKDIARALCPPRLVHDAEVDRFEAGMTWSRHFVDARRRVCTLVFAHSEMTLKSF